MNFLSQNVSPPLQLLPTSEVAAAVPGSWAPLPSEDIDTSLLYAETIKKESSIS